MDLNYLNHKFINLGHKFKDVYLDDKWSEHKFLCESCNVLIYFTRDNIATISSYSKILTYKYGAELKLTCNEVLIKNIIE